MSTLSELYLGSEPTSVSIIDDRLVITLKDTRTLAIPLEFASQFQATQTLSDQAVLLILRQAPQIEHVLVNDSFLSVYLKDGRLLACPLSWFPRLLHGSSAERNHYELFGDDDGIHWPELDEDVTLLRLFEGGKSLESEESIQRWLATRQHANPSTLSQ